MRNPFRSITVLSPHRDDAVFSLGLWLRHWTEKGLSVSVWNFYTQSEYAPWIPPRADVTSRRAYEDRAAIRAVSAAIRIRALHLVDAPVRMGSVVANVMQQNTAAVRPCDVQEVAQTLTHLKAEWALAPLGLGGHIDHLTVRTAAVETIPAERLVFYEDLPYAAWASDSELRSSIEAVQRTPLRPMRLKSGFESCLKKKWAARYASQIQREDAVLIGRHRPETIWVPRWAKSL